ncbi:hypothetical protein J6590_059402 [Homalodisca vitripennis]|nr:hypothetical protein J6590_059402 [Homalodisca vitripennis]
MTGLSYLPSNEGLQVVRQSATADVFIQQLTSLEADSMQLTVRDLEAFTEWSEPTRSLQRDATSLTVSQVVDFVPVFKVIRRPVFEREVPTAEQRSKSSGLVDNVIAESRRARYRAKVDVVMDYRGGLFVMGCRAVRFKLLRSEHLPLPLLMHGAHCDRNTRNQMDTRQLWPAWPFCKVKIHAVKLTPANCGRPGLFVKSKYKQSN